MKILLRLFCAACVLVPVASCQSVDLLVRTDAECRLTVDGTARDRLRPGESVRLSLPPGEHQIAAVSLVEGARWEKTVKVAAAREPQVIIIPLQATLAAAKAKNQGYWTDPDTQLTWTAADDGSGVSLSQAGRYCRELTLGGFNDWTLPSIDDLQGLFGGAENQGGYHIKGPIKLTGWQWSASPGNQAGEGWALDFGDGGRASVAAGDSGLNRALCVRHARGR